MASYLNFPFDAEIFDYKWREAKDTTLLALLESGAMVEDENIRDLISNGSDTYTMPYYNLLGGDEDNYDGQTNINQTYTNANSITGVVYGRAHAFTAKDFIKDFNSGADPMDYIASKVSNWYGKKRQSRIAGILNTVLDKTANDSEWAKHTTNIAVAANTETPNEANFVGADTAGKAVQKAIGDQAGEIVLAIMHSKVATNLAALQLLQFRKYTDEKGIERQLNIADWNGLTVIVTDTDTSKANTTSEQTEYITYLLGRGCLAYAPAPVEHPSALVRDEFLNGGEESLVTRLRETIMPYGFSFVKPQSGYTASPTDTQLKTANCWSRQYDAKTIPMVKVVSNG